MVYVFPRLRLGVRIQTDHQWAGSGLSPLKSECQSGLGLINEKNETKKKQKKTDRQKPSRSIITRSGWIVYV